METSNKKVVLIGGGTGISSLLRGLKTYPVSLSAIVTTADTGGSSGVLRRETGMAPPGDVRQCFVALNEDADPIVPLFNERFAEGGLKGHSFGNLFFALLWQKYRDFPQAVRVAEQMVGATHHVIPVTHEPTDLVAYLKDGSSISSEENIIQYEGLCESLERLEIAPSDVRLNEEARTALESADLILVGPGNLVGSLVPPMLVPGLAQALQASSARKVYVANLLNQPTTGRAFTVEDYLAFFERVLGKNIFDTVIYNTGEFRKERATESAQASSAVLLEQERADVAYIGEDLVAAEEAPIVAGDMMVRNTIKHDAERVATLIYERLIKDA